MQQLVGLVERHRGRPCRHAGNTTASSLLTNLLTSLRNQHCSQTKARLLADNLYHHAGSTMTSSTPTILLASLRNQHCNQKATTLRRVQQVQWLGSHA